MNDEERDRPVAGGPQQSFGSAPDDDGTGTFGTAPGGQESMGKAPSGRGNVGLLVGGGIAILVVLAALFGFLIK